MIQPPKEKKKENSRFVPIFIFISLKKSLSTYLSPIRTQTPIQSSFSLRRDGEDMGESSSEDDLDMSEGYLIIILFINYYFFLFYSFNFFH